MPFKRNAILIALMIYLSACNYSLVADVTPIPGYQSMSRGNESGDAGLFYPLVPPDPAMGEGIYLEECSPCHGHTGMGDGPNSTSLPIPVPAIGNLSVARQATLEDWFLVITQGDLERYMPPFKLLTDRQRWDVAAYALNLNISEQDLTYSLQLFKDYCSKCHGIHGNGRDSDADFQGIPDFTMQEYMAVKSTTDFYLAITNGSGIDMPSFVDSLSENERWQMANYVRSLSYSPSEHQPSVSSTASPPRAAPISPSDTTTELPGLVTTQTLGTISGKVNNVSGNELPSGLVITLHAFEQMQEVYTATTSLMVNSGYHFDGIEMPMGSIFMTSVKYKDVVYSSEPVVVEENQLNLNLDLEVYETTTDTEALEIDRLHYFFELLPGGDDVVEAERILRVIELYVISNTGTKTLISKQDDQPVISFHLPVGASNLELQDGGLGDRFMRTSDGFGDTQPIQPGNGKYQVMFSYSIPYSKDLSPTWPVVSPIKALVILVPGSGIEVVGDRIMDAGLRDFQGLQYHVYEGNDFSPGQEIKLKITESRMNRRIILTTGSITNLVIGLMAFLASLTFAILWVYRLNINVKPTNDKSPERMIKPVSDDPETIMDTILALDDLHQEGSLPEDAYIRRRGELKARLKELMGD